MSNVNSKYPLIRIPKELYDDVKIVADRKGISIGEALEYTWKSSKRPLPSIQREKEKMESRHRVEMIQMRNQMQKEISAQYEVRIKELEDMLKDVQIKNERLFEENQIIANEMQGQFQLNKYLEDRIKELEEQLKQSDVSKLMNEIEVKNSEIGRLNEKINQLKDNVSNLEMDNKALREALRKSSSEVKWIKENIKKDLEDMLKANSLLDIQPMLRTLVNRIEGLNLDNLLI